MRPGGGGCSRGLTTSKVTFPPGPPTVALAVTVPRGVHGWCGGWVAGGFKTTVTPGRGEFDREEPAGVVVCPLDGVALGLPACVVCDVGDGPLDGVAAGVLAGVEPGVCGPVVEAGVCGPAVEAGVDAGVCAGVCGPGVDAGVCAGVCGPGVEAGGGALCVGGSCGGLCVGGPPVGPPGWPPPPGVGTGVGSDQANPALPVIAERLRPTATAAAAATRFLDMRSVPSGAFGPDDVWFACAYGQATVISKDLVTGCWLLSTPLAVPLIA